MTEPLTYWLDGSDRIVRVSENWDDQARVASSLGPTTQSVLGRSVYDFIHGDTARMYLHTVLQYVRVVKRELVRPYRCDAPGLKRFMEMRVCLEDEFVRLEHHCLREEPLQSPRPLQFGTGIRVVLRCSVCNRLEIGGAWKEPDEVEPARGASRFRCANGVCPDCVRELPAVN